MHQNIKLNKKKKKNIISLKVITILLYKNNGWLESIKMLWNCYNIYLLKTNTVDVAYNTHFETSTIWVL